VNVNTRKSRKAKARLTNMTVGAVGLVDKPANLRPFVVTKADTAPADTAPGAAAPAAGQSAEAAKDATTETAPAAKAELVFSPEAKQAALEAVGVCLEELSAIATMIADAKTQDGAPVPAELGQLLMGVADRLEAAAEANAPAPAANAEMANAPANTGTESGLSRDAIKEALKEALTEFAAKAQQEQKAAPEGVAKSSEIAELRTLIKAVQAQALSFGVRNSAPVSNAGQVDKSATQAAKSSSVAWPSDLAADATNTAKSSSQEKDKPVVWSSDLAAGL
jgi:hypothetical protein